MKKFLLKLGSSIFIILFLVWVSDHSSVWAHIQEIDKYTILYCMAILCAAQAISSIRWQWILKTDGALIPFSTLFASYMTGMFVNNLMPTNIGGDGIKVYDIYRITKDSSLAIVSVFLDRFFGLIALILLSWFGINSVLPLMPNIIMAGWILINITCALILLLIFYDQAGKWVLGVFNIQKLTRIIKVLHLAHERLTLFKHKKLFLIKLLLISFVIQLGTIIIYIIIAYKLGMNLPIVFFLFSVPLIVTISLLPVSVGGLGIREGATIFIFSITGITSEAALSLSLIFTGITFLTSLAGALFLFFRKTRLKGIQKQILNIQ